MSLGGFKYLRTIVTDQNCIHEVVQGISNMGNGCYHSVLNPLSSCLQFKMLPVVLYRCLRTGCWHLKKLTLVSGSRLESTSCSCSNLCYNFRSGTCHGIALWVEWDLDGNPKHAISMGPKETVHMNRKVVWDMHTRQGVYFLQKHRLVDTACSVSFRVHFRPQNGDIEFHFDVNPSSAEDYYWISQHRQSCQYIS